jgi:hypothetical protein
MKRLYLLTFFTVLAAAGIFLLRKKDATTIAAGDGLVVPKEWLIEQRNPSTPAADLRPPDQTFLTYPEWYLVFSPEEQAKYYERHTATTFPFMSHTAQIWDSYRIVNDQIEGNFPPNPGYHLMIRVIGVSSSVEYACKAWYETVVGRVTDTGAPLTEEDQFNAKFTREYVDFIKDIPWYEFDFKGQLKKLWTDVPLTGEHLIRKAERRYILTSELMFKYVYGKLIGLGTAQVYEPALLHTGVILSNDSTLSLPRYDRFVPAAMALAKQGYTFKEIAGNKSAIMITVLVSSEHSINFSPAKTIFIQPITSSAELKRVAVAIPVEDLHSLLLNLDRNYNYVLIEHIFDF